MSHPYHQIKNRASQLAQRRALLVTECALQRMTLASQCRSISHMTSWMNLGRNLITIVRKGQGWKSVLLAGVMTFMPGRPFSLIKNGLLFWQVWRMIFPKRSQGKQG